MFPVYNASIPHAHNSHTHTHTSHPHSQPTHQPHQPTHPSLDHHPASSTQPTTTNRTPEASTAPASAAAALPLYTSYQLQHKAGYLHKEGDVWKTWKRRYFVLSSLLLSYYPDRDSTAAKGHIALQGAEVRPSQRGDRPGWLFEVYRDEHESDHRVYYLEAASEQERSEWMSAIKNNVLLELNRTRALVDEVDKYQARIAQLTDELERQRAKQILADLNKPRADSHPAATALQPTQPPPSSSTAPPQQQQHARSPSTAAMYDQLSYLQAEHARLLAENQSLKRSTLAMQGRGNEIRQTPETHRDESVADTAAAGAAVGGGDGEVEALKKELARVRMERSILKREVLRLMKVTEEATHAAPATTPPSSAQPSQSTGAAPV